MKRLRILIVAIGLFAIGATAAVALADKPPSPPGKDPCSHGNTGKPCKPDPQPDRGKDCEKHGKEGGVNEDHCKGEATTTTTDTTDTTTTTNTTTTTETTTTTNTTTTQGTTTSSTPTTTTTSTTPSTSTTPGSTTTTPAVVPPAVPPTKAKPPKVEGPTPPKKTPTGKSFCPNGTPVFKGKCYPVARGSG